MHDDCRPWWSDNLVGCESVDAVLVDDIAITYDGVGGLGQFYCALLVIAVENHHHVVPLVAKFIKVLISVNHEAVATWQELERSSSRGAQILRIGDICNVMILTQGDEVLVVFKHLRVTLQVIPVEVVDAVGRLKGVMHPFLVAQQLLATQHERYTLGSEDGGLRKQVKTYHFVIGDSRHLGSQAVNETHVIVTTDV